MSAGINKAIFIGHLGKDPEVKQLKNSSVAEFSIAINETWYDKDKKKQERTEWVNVVAWGKLAEICQKYLAKGKQVYIEGRLRTTSWDDKNGGGKRYKTELVAETIRFIGSARDGGKRMERSEDPGPGADDFAY